MAWSPEPLGRLPAGDDSPHQAHLVHGRVLAPLGPALELPDELAGLIAAGPAIVAARIDIEEEILPLVRPARGRVELGVDFLLGDDTGRAHVRLGEPPHLHPDADLHLGAAAVSLPLTPDDDGIGRTAWLRVVRVGDEIALWGRATRAPDAEGAAYRDAPALPAFSPTLGALALYDAAAVAALVEWWALPWHRKLAALVRGRGPVLH